MDTETILTKFDLPLGRCRSCGLVYANPRRSKEEIWTRYSPDYFWKEYLPDHGVVDGQFDLAAFDARYAPMLNLIARSLPPPGRLLEIGAGAGFFLKAAERAGWEVTGTEVSQAAVDFARQRLGLDVRLESAEAMTVDRGVFDVAVMIEVIEHLLDPGVALKTVRNALRGDGFLVVTTPNFDSVSRHFLGRDWSVLSPGEHLYNFSEKTLGRLLVRCGFESVRFIRDFEGFGLHATMNPRNSHKVNGFRTRVYQAFVLTFGLGLFRFVKTWGLGDTLVVVARA